MVIVDVLGFRVSPVVVPMFHASTPGPVIVQVPLPMFKVRVRVPLELKVTAVTLKFAAVNVPWSRLNVPVE
jgi:hypothetical protein